MLSRRVGIEHGVVQAALLVAIVASHGGWSVRVIGPVLVLLAACFHPAAAASVAAGHAAISAVLSPSAHLEAAMVGALAGLAITPVATVAVVVWASLTAALVTGAVYANLALWWCVPASAVVAAVPAALLALPVSQPPQSKSKESPQPERATFIRQASLRPKLKDASLFV